MSMKNSGTSAPVCVFEPHAFLGVRQETRSSQAASSAGCRHPSEWQNCSTLPPASLSGEGLEGRVAAVSAQEFNWPVGTRGFALVGGRPKKQFVSLRHFHPDSIN